MPKGEAGTGYFYTETRIKEDATPIDDITKFAWYDDDYEEIELWHEYTQEELANIQKLSDIQQFLQDNPMSMNDLEDAVAELGDLVAQLLGEGA
ncbi:MAG: hypothetical protein HUJ63_10785 [Enterococcus sp.]|nr:hypothetical protein [Enterococcus sp.]